MNSAVKVKPLFGSVGGSHPLARLIDHRETYGPHIVEHLVRGLSGLKVVVDLGAGSGRDLMMAKKIHAEAKLIAVEGGSEYARSLTERWIRSTLLISSAIVYR
jgi:predicted RNA methylase